jgi:hypothetical protein
VDGRARRGRQRTGTPGVAERRDGERAASCSHSRRKHKDHEDGRALTERTSGSSRRRKRKRGKAAVWRQPIGPVWKAFCSCSLGSFDFDLRPGPVIPELAGQICDMLWRVSRVTAPPPACAAPCSSSGVCTPLRAALSRSPTPPPACAREDRLSDRPHLPTRHRSRTRSALCRCLVPRRWRLPRPTPVARCLSLSDTTSVSPTGAQAREGAQTIAWPRAVSAR